MAAYKAKYGASIAQVTTAVPQFYDAVNIVAAAIKADRRRPLALGRSTVP